MISRITKFSYHKITENLKPLTTLVSEDKTNLTCTNRPVERYNKLLNVDLEKIILEQAELHGRKINLLDAGCGKAVAIDELLANDKLKNALNTCTGVSINYFSNIEAVSEKHTERFIYFKGTAQDLLKKQSNQYDIIVDAWGAYSYSEDKLALLKLYHQALTPYGVAEVHTSGKKTILIKEEKKEIRMIHLCKKYPDSFTYHKKLVDDYHVRSITLTKSSARFPLPDYKVKHFDEVATVKRKKYAISELRKGNAICPTKVIYTPLETPELRPLPFKK